MKIIVYRDESGKVINIGEWDFMISNDEEIEGNMVVNNPIPNGVTSKIEEVVINQDGSRSVIQ